jgi:uncharacterized membrane protein YdjX (TVP38/TMEM64 family)
MKLNKFFYSQKNIKLALGLAYLLFATIFLWLFFSNFNYQDFTSYKFIQSNIDYLILFKEQNIFLTSCALILFIIIWVIFLGFGTPIGLIGGFFFGKWFGTFLVILGLTIGSSILYIIAIYFFQDLIKKIFYKKFKYLQKKFKKEELLIMIFFRIVGLVPFFIANLLPSLFNIKLKNYFFGTLIGITPSIFILCSLGSGIENIITTNNTMPSFISVITSSEIYFPLLGFVLILMITFFIKKKIK